MNDRYPDEVSRVAASRADLQRFDEADAALVRMPVPILHNAGADSRVFLAFFDGTGNDALDLAKGDTNVEVLHVQAERAAANDGRIGTYYLRGPGTQENVFERGLDGMSGGTFEQRLETMYFRYCAWARQALQEDPDAKISLITVGFSRGAEQGAAFTRMVAERGVQDVEHARIVTNEEGLVTSATYPGPALRSGRDIAQAVVLFDPVGTGEPHHHDRRLPPQVLSGLQFTAVHERRDLFESTRILDPGFTHDGRFLNLYVPGDHTDAGGSYDENGLARRTFNRSADYLNALIEPPIFRKAHLRPDMDVIHRSVEHLPIYDDDVFRRNERRGLPEEQLRGHREIIGGNPRDRSAGARDAEPIDAALDARFERRALQIGPVPETPAEFRDRVPAQQRDDLQPEAPRRSILHLLLSPLADADARGDAAARRAALDAYLASPMGQAFTAQVEARAQAAREADLAASQSVQHEERAHRARAMAV